MQITWRRPDALEAELDALIRAPEARGAPGGGMAGAAADPGSAWRAFFGSRYLCESEAEAGVAAHARRYRELLEAFRRWRAAERVGIARAPGRINLIGEHTDYNDGPVLPAAVDRDIVAVFAPRDDARVRVRNRDNGYPERSFEITERIPPFAQGDWGNYVKAGVQGLVNWSLRRDPPGQTRGGGRAGAVHAELPPLRGFDVLLHGTIPEAAGLSSSSALVVLSALLFLGLNERALIRPGGRPGGRSGPSPESLSPQTLAPILAEAERYVGTRGGGMDQTISLLGREDAALYIDFAKNETQPVPLPEEYRFVIAHSLVPAPKSAEAMVAYNRRAAESRIAAELLRRSIEEHTGAAVREQSVGTLRSYAERLGTETFRRVAEQTAHPDPYTLEETLDVLDIDEDTLQGTYLVSEEALAALRREVLKLHQRLQHVLEECERVEAMAEAFAEGDVRSVGRLMNASHESCRNLYEISTPEVDRLVEIEREAGAVGARMTGAGFGGCTIFLVPRSGTRGAIDSVIEHYYHRERSEQRADYSSIIFPVKAVPGAELL
jgi:N-acetylgalactosamine kinase